MFASLKKSGLLPKVLTLLALMVLLSVPLARIEWLVAERGATRQAAVEELATTYAGPQTLLGPVLVVPYTEHWTEVQLDDKGRVRARVARSKAQVHLAFPARMAIDGEVQPQRRERGIFQVLFYRLQGRWSGEFPATEATRLPRTEKDATVELGTPWLAFALSDVRGIEGAPVLGVAGAAQRFLPGVPGLAAGSPLARGIHAPLEGAALEAFRAGRPLPFGLQLAVVGQERLAVAPLADETTARLDLRWPHLRFGGRFLATQRVPVADGFEARWAVSSLVSAAARQLSASAFTPAAAGTPAAVDTFEVALIEPQNPYSLADRAVKYGALFVALVLMAAFMFELFRRLRLHPVQYALVGLSIAVFFLLLLALSEKLAFGLAYGLAAGASVALLAAYFSAMLGGVARGASLAGFVALLYGALYGLLVSEDSALLMGALLVFAMLAALMLLTRKVDWYALSSGAARGPEDA